MKNRRKTPDIDTDNQQREKFCETSPEQESNAPEVGTYKIIRFRFNGGNEVLYTGVTLDEAREHCQQDHTSGEGWFDGYQTEAGE